MVFEYGLWARKIQRDDGSGDAFRAVGRFARMVGWIARFIVASVFVGIVERGARQRRARRLKLLRFYASRACRSLGIHIQEDFSFPKEENGLFVSNHLSFLDILIHASLRELVFVTSNEMKETPFVGWMVKLAGGTFIERRHRRDLRSDLENLSAILEDGFSVMLFPEGTTGDGSRVLDFKSGLFSSAISAAVSVYPTTLNYLRFNGRPVTEANRNDLCLLKEHSLGAHLWRVFSASGIDAHVSRHVPIRVDPSDHPRILAREAQRVIEGSFRVFQVTENRAGAGSFAKVPGSRLEITLLERGA